MLLHVSYFAKFRLVPNREIKQGWVGYVVCDEIVSVEKFNPERDDPYGVSAIAVSIEDYWRLTTLIANTAALL